jgi:hypothetical protein
LRRLSACSNVSQGIHAAATRLGRTTGTIWSKTMRNPGTLCAAALLGLPLAAAASTLSYNYVEADYVKVEPDDSDADFDGFRAKISGRISEAAYVFASYGELESDRGANRTLEQEVITAGLGLRAPLGRYTDFNAEAAYVHADFTDKGPFGGREDDNGFGLGAGLRHLFTPQFEGGVKLDYVDVFDDDETTLTFSGLFHLTPQLSLGAAYSISDDADGWNVGGRFNF